MKFATILSISLILPTMSWSLERPETNASELLSEAAFIGLQLSVSAGLRDGKVNAQVAQCVRSLDRTSLQQSFRSAIEESWSTSERAEIDAFLNTPLGKKFSTQSILSVYIYAFEKPPEELPVFTDSERTTLAELSQTSWGRKFLVQKEFEKASARETIKSGMLSLLRSCGIGKR